MMILRSIQAGRLCAALLLASACGGADTAPRREADDEQRLLTVTAEDAEMNAAIARARATAPELLSRLRNPPPGMNYLGVKVRVGDGDRREHIWLYDVREEGGAIVGRLTEDAVYYKQIRQGDTVRVSPGEISDWMTVENGHACGGFTARVMQPEMSAEERAAYLREMEIPRLPPGDLVCDTAAPAERAKR